MSVAELFTGTIKHDLFYLTCGKQLGAGSVREVYECNFDPSIVLKFEEAGGSFQNVIEWNVWERIQCTNLAKWFAPCVDISSNGSILLMKKTESIREAELPERIPNFLTDLKPSNWGMYNGHPVVHDYGLNLLMEKGMTKRMVKVDWEYWN